MISFLCQEEEISYFPFPFIQVKKPGISAIGAKKLNDKST
jgi:hypothetical protein